MGTEGIGHIGRHHLIWAMPSFQDQVYLVSDQYKDAGNLDARIQLHKRFSTNPYGWFQWVFDQLDLPFNARILEIGCGSGALWLDNLPRLRMAWHIILSDFSMGMVRECRQKLGLSPGQFSLGSSNALAVPFSAESFDAVIANHMLYHVSDRQKAISEIARVLKPGGILYAATNGERHLLELDRLVMQYCQDCTIGILDGKPSRHFTLENGAAQLTPWFEKVCIREYEDALEVTEIEPIMAYIKSMLPRYGSQVDTSVNSNLYQAILKQLQKQASIHIGKSTGLLIGIK